MNLAGIAFGTLFSMFQGPVQTGPLTLDEALKIAEQNAFAIKIQQSIIEQNRQRIAEARANMGPKVTISGTYTRFEKAGTSTFGGQSIVTQPIDSKQVSATASIPIDIAGNLGRLVQAAREREESARNTLRAAVSDVRLNTKQAYFNVLRNEGLVGVAEQRVVDAQEQLLNAQRLFAQQQVARVDVTRFETQLSQAQAELIAAKNARQLSHQQFNLTLARPIETEVQLAPVTELPPIQLTPDTLVQTAQAQRPELLALGDTLQALANIRRAQEAGMNPSLGFSLQHNRPIGAAGANSGGPQTFGTLQLSLPVFDSGLTRAKVRAARQDEEQMRINIEQAKLNISQEVRTALANLAGARARLDNAEAQVTLATEVLRLARVRQSAGAGTYIEVIDAETALTAARNALVSARYDYLTSYAQLQRAVGSDSLTAPATTGGTK
ncbi:MAG: TolC family protein [Fimbriimonas sp.]